MPRHGDRSSCADRIRRLAARGPGRGAFTLVEVLIVVGIIALLLSISVPSMVRARESTRRVVCMNGLRQTGTACNAYAISNNRWTPNMPRAGSVTPGSINDGSRNLQHVQNRTSANSPPGERGPEGVGKMMETGYLPIDPMPFYCPSRDRRGRYAELAVYWGWPNWARGGTVEYAYQHRIQRRLSDAQPWQVYGADLGIMDYFYLGTTPYGLISVGADIAHGDNYYNVSYFDQTVDSFTDEDEVLESTAYFNRPGRVLNTIEELDDQ